MSETHEQFRLKQNIVPLSRISLEGSEAPSACRGMLPHRFRNQTKVA